MTDNQSDKLDEIIEKLHNISKSVEQTSENLARGWMVTVRTPPADKLDKIIEMLTPMTENIQAIRRHLEDKEQAKTSPGPPPTLPTQT